MTIIYLEHILLWQQFILLELHTQLLLLLIFRVGPSIPSEYKYGIKNLMWALYVFCPYLFLIAFLFYLHIFLYNRRIGTVETSTAKQAIIYFNRFTLNILTALIMADVICFCFFFFIFKKQCFSERSSSNNTFA